MGDEWVGDEWVVLDRGRLLLKPAARCAHLCLEDGGCLHKRGVGGICRIKHQRLREAAAGRGRGLARGVRSVGRGTWQEEQSTTEWASQYMRHLQCNTRQARPRDTTLAGSPGRLACMHAGGVGWGQLAPLGWRPEEGPGGGLGVFGEGEDQLQQGREESESRGGAGSGVVIAAAKQRRVANTATAIKRPRLNSTSEASNPPLHPATHPPMRPSPLPARPPPTHLHHPATHQPGPPTCAMRSWNCCWNLRRAQATHSSKLMQRSAGGREGEGQIGGCRQAGAGSGE